MSEFVLDASITLSWFFEDEVTPFGDWVLGRLAQDTAVVPAVHWELEVAQAMLKGQRRGRMARLTPDKFRELLRKLRFRHAVGGRGLDEVMALAAKHLLLSYDAAYLDLAIRGRLPMSTLDEALEAANHSTGMRFRARLPMDDTLFPTNIHGKVPGDPFERTVDFRIIGTGGARSDLVEGLHLALLRAGVDSMWTAIHMAHLLADGCASGFMADDLERSRVVVILYSEQEASSQRPYDDPWWRRNSLIPTILHAISNAAAVVVVLIDGEWPLPEAPVPVILCPDDAATLVASLFRIAGIALFGRKLEDARFATLARVFKNGLSAAMQGQCFRVFLFGPGKPEETFTALLSFEGKLWQVREHVRTQLDHCDVMTVYGEDLESLPASVPETSMNPSLKERLFATEVDAIVFLAGSVGSAAELGVFSQHEDLCKKSIIFVCKDHMSGFLARGPARECANYGATFEEFDKDQLDGQALQSRVVQAVLTRFEGAVARAFRKAPDRDAGAR